MSFRKTFIKAWGFFWRRYTPFEAFLPEASQEDLVLFRKVQPFTMTSVERMNALLTAVRYICANDIAGDIVECGVWRGGSMMLVAEALLRLKQGNRHLHLYDTFAGMTVPSAKDSSRFEKLPPTESFATSKKEGEVVHWSYAGLDEVRRNVLSTGYEERYVHFVKGPVEQTIPGKIPERIALLRLDTDFYESSKHEMIHLFPRLVQGGVLILDDFGHWEGQRLAVEEYLAEHKVKLLLNRIDYTGRIGVKCGSSPG
jgi:O-methyltransferase